MEINLVIGGAKSGKSAFAERQLAGEKQVCYLATGMVFPDDPEWLEKIHVHQKRRPASWGTQEQYRDLALWLEKASYQHYLLDSVTSMTSQWLLEGGEKTRTELEKELKEEWQEIFRVLASKEGTCWIVTDEVGLSLVPDSQLGRDFRDLLGQVNQWIAEEADRVYLVIAGLVQELK